MEEESGVKLKTKNFGSKKSQTAPTSKVPFISIFF